MIVRGALLLLVAVLLLPVPVRAGEEDGVLAGLEREIRALVDGAGPAVVKVTAEVRAPGAAPALARTVRVGTGFLVSADGLVLTTWDVAGGTEKARVEFPGGESLDGEVLGGDPFFRVAVVRIAPPAGVRPLPLADGAEGPPVGTLGILLGNSFGVSRNISLSIVTGSGRSGAPFDPFDNYLVLNASGNPGDNGGPLLDRHGRVLGMGAGLWAGAVGLVSAGVGGEAEIRGLPGTMGIGFAVPATDLRFALSEIRDHGRVRRGVLGIVLRTRSLEVREVLPDSTAAAAGLRPEDVIAEVGGCPLRSAFEFGFRLRRIPVGAEVPMVVVRGGERVAVRPVLGEFTPGDEPLFSGIAIQTVGGRVVVAAVSGRLAKAGVQVGDVVTEVNDEPVTDGEVLFRIFLSNPKSAPLDLLLLRNGESVRLTVEGHAGR